MGNQSQHNRFIISVAGANLDISVINIEEMSAYCQGRNRLANVVTEKKSYSHLEKINYGLVGNYNKAKPRVINSKNSQYLKVYTSLSQNYKSGLLVVEDDTISEPIIELFCKNDSWAKNDVDIMLCRNSLSMISADEVKCANYLRISADPEFSPMILPAIESLWKEKIISIMVAQYFVNDQYDTVKAYIKKQSDYYNSQGITDFVDYYEINRQLAYFIYYDIENDKIINVNNETMVDFLKKLSAKGIIPLDDAKVKQLADLITLS